MNNKINESDWKVFKKLKPLALDRYCKRVLNEVDEIINDDNVDLHERYSKMYEVVRERDKRMAQIFDHFSRSGALFDLLIYCRENLISEDEFSMLSEESQERIRAIKNI